MKAILFYFFLFLGAAFNALAQQPVSATVDSAQIKIGSSFELTIKVQADKEARVVFPDTKLMGPFEVLESKPVDTVLADRKTAFIKKYMLTQFDSGFYTLPRQSIYINGKNYQTDLFNITVNNVQVDTLKQPLYDIKTNAGTATDTSKLPYYIAAVIGCLLLGYFVYWLIKKRQDRNLTEDDLFRTPLEKATRKLEELDGKRLVMSGNVKAYYSEITDITRDYIEEVFEIPAKESTSSELIRQLTDTIRNKKIKLGKDIISDLKRVLQTADLVKFAKSEPLISEIESDRKTAEKVSVEMDRALPRFAEEQSSRVRLREQRFRKRKRIRTWVPVGITAILLLTTGMVYLYQSVIDGMNINFLQSNKRLYNQEWVNSEYGFPSIKIETPEALVRLPNRNGNKESLQQNQANFMYTNWVTNLTINLSTTAVTTDEKTDIEQLFKYKLQLLEQSLGAKDVKSEAEKFNQEGIEGLRGFGSFRAVNPKSGKEQQFQFEVYIFLQKNGVQEISVIYNLDDEYGQKIARKVFESIQLNVNQQ